MHCQSSVPLFAKTPPPFAIDVLVTRCCALELIVQEYYYPINFSYLIELAYSFSLAHFRGKGLWPVLDLNRLRLESFMQKMFKMRFEYLFSRHPI